MRRGNQRSAVTAAVAGAIALVCGSTGWARTATQRPRPGDATYVVAAGDSLWTIARAHHCRVDDLRLANHLSGDLILAGQHLRIPECVPGEAAGDRLLASLPPPVDVQSVGRPQDGHLLDGVQIPRDPAAYHLRRPWRAWGTNQTVSQVVRVIERVHRAFPGVHPLAIGDLSARRGGKITMHVSHQSGRDIDLGFYFNKRPPHYPDEFVVATADNLDFDATWALITGLAATADRPDGVERMFMSYDTQRLFWRLALKHGVARATLERLFQYPHGQGSRHGLIHHEPGHDEHVHVRFKCPPRDRRCEGG